MGVVLALGTSGNAKQNGVQKKESWMSMMEHGRDGIATCSHECPTRNRDSLPVDVVSLAIFTTVVRSQPFFVSTALRASSAEP